MIRNAGLSQLTQRNQIKIIFRGVYNSLDPYDSIVRYKKFYYSFPGSLDREPIRYKELSVN